MSVNDIGKAVKEFLRAEDEFNDYIRTTPEFEATLGYTGILIREVGKEAGIRAEFHSDGKVRYRRITGESIPGVWISQKETLRILMETDQRINGKMYELMRAKPINELPF